MPVVYETSLQKSKDRERKILSVVGYEGTLLDLTLKEEEGGIPVCRIAAHAFENRTDLRRAILPQSISCLGPFSFYGCTSLFLLDLYNTTVDIGDGVIRQCPGLCRIVVRCIQEGEYQTAKDLLRDVERELTFHFMTKEGEIRLTFPDYVNEAREDTMARAIHFSIEGAGVAYRECVGRHALDLTGYDRLFDHLTEYDSSCAVKIAMGRLACPMALSMRAKSQYEEYLRSHDEKTLIVILNGTKSTIPEEQKDWEEYFSLFLHRSLLGKEALEKGLELASSLGQRKECSALLDYRSKTFPEEEECFSLDW